MGFFGRRKRQRAALQQFGNALRVTPKDVPAKTISNLTGEVVSTADSVSGLRDALASLPVLVTPAGWNPYLRDDAQVTTATIEWARWLSEALARHSDSDEGTPRAPRLLPRLSGKQRAVIGASGSGERVARA